MAGITVLTTVVVKAVVVGVLLLLARMIAWMVKLLVWSPLFDPLRKLPGPEGSALQSHLGTVME